jgi:tyrosinase
MGSFLGLVRVLLLSLFVSAAVASNSGCGKPKVRREWRKLSPRDKGDWIKAVKCLAGLPHTDKLVPTVPLNESLIPPVNQNTSFYDDLIYLHMDLNNKIHFTGQFLPWHRYFVQYFEDVLKKKCGYKGVQPYWDWTLDAEDFYNSDIFDDDPRYGLGGWGDPNNDYQITTGGFKDIVRPYPTPHHIRRNFTLFPFDNPAIPPPFADDPTAPRVPPDFMVNTTITPQNVEFMVNSFEGDFEAFQAYMESLTGPHAGPHVMVGADLAGFCPHNVGPPDCYAGPKWTPNDPLFFLHHAMVDKVWSDWQDKSPKNKYSYGGGSVGVFGNNFTLFTTFPTGYPPHLSYSSQIPGDGLWDDVEIWDVMDTTGNKLCYTYA